MAARRVPVRVPVRVKKARVRPEASGPVSALAGLADRLSAAGHLLGVAARPGRAALSSATDALTRAAGTLAPAARLELLRGLAALLSTEAMQPANWRTAVSTVARTLKSAKPPGDRSTDEFGLDMEFYDAVRPLVNVLYRYWFRVDARGLEHVPAKGRALLVPNHSGTLAFDGAMISNAIWEQHRKPRPVRFLALSWFFRLPFVSVLLSRTGCALACPENGERLLNAGQLVGVFPEGVKGGSKLYRDRYKLKRFGRGGFAKMALRTRAPILPIAVVGAEETYPALAHWDWLAKPLGLPVFPITPTFPWLGALGLIPLPSKWRIRFGEPIRLSESAPERAEDQLIVSLLTEKVRTTIQALLDDLLLDRDGVFF